MDELSHDALRQKVRDLEKELAERIRAESRLQFQNDICRVLSTTIGRPDAWRRLLEVIVARDGIDAGGLYFVSRSSGEINLVSHTGLSPSCLAAVSHFEAGSHQASLMRAGKPVYASPDRFLPGYSNILRIDGPQAVGAIPVEDDGQVIGMLLVASRKHLSIPAETRGDLEAGTALLVGFLAQVNSNKTKTEDQETYRSLFAASPVGIGLARNRIIKWGNKALHDMLGYQPDALKDKNVRMIYADEATYEQVGYVLYTGLQKKGIEQMETQWLTRDGRIIDCHLQASVLDPLDPSKGVLFAAMDISKYKQTENALRESEAQKMAILEASIDWIRHVDKDMNILWHNKITAEALQLPSEKILGRPCYAVLHDRSTPCDGCPTVKAMKSGRIERAVMHRPGSADTDAEFYWEAYSVPLKNETGEIVSFIQISKDITEQVRAMEALREGEEKYRQLFESESDAVMIFDGETLRFEEANQATLDLYGYTRKEFLSLTVVDISNEKDKTRATVQRIINNDPGSKRIPLRYFKKKDGTVFPGEVFSGTFKSGNQVKIIGAVRDITERLQAEEKIHALTQEQMKAQEKERLEISRYLHDQVAQDLSTLRIGCETLFDSQPSTEVAVRQKITEMSSILQNTISAVRNLSYDLRPPGMDHLGLARTLLQYCEDFSKKHNLQIDYHSAGMADLKTDYETEINLFRVAQEALNNINLHAAASRVTIRLVASFPSIIMRIEDNGKGFDVEGSLIKAAGERRMGLGNMQERVRLLNGNLKIHSRPQAGTKILVEIPFTDKNSDFKTEHPHH